MTSASEPAASQTASQPAPQANQPAATQPALLGLYLPIPPTHTRTTLPHSVSHPCISPPPADSFWFSRLTSQKTRIGVFVIFNQMNLNLRMSFSFSMKGIPYPGQFRFPPLQQPWLLIFSLISSRQRQLPCTRVGSQPDSQPAATHAPKPASSHPANQPASKQRCQQTAGSHPASQQPDSQPASQSAESQLANHQASQPTNQPNSQPTEKMGPMGPNKIRRCLFCS